MVFKGRISFVELINMPAGVLSKLYHIAVERAEARAEEAEKNGKNNKDTKGKSTAIDYIDIDDIEEAMEG